MRQKVLFVLLLLLLAVPFPLSAQVDCYSSTRNQGIALMGQGHYSEAIEVFQSAMLCPDKPANNDLQAKINECQSKKPVQDAERKKRKSEEARRAAVNAQKREAEIAEKGFMDARGLRFANTVGGRFLGDTDGPFYENDIRFIQPILSYRGLTGEPKTVELCVKFLDPDGSLLGGTSTPDGYSYKQTVTVLPEFNRLSIDGWGKRDASIFFPGIHTCEIWFEGKKLITGTFTVLEEKIAGRSDYFAVTGISLANVTFDNRVLDDYGSTLYSDDLRFLKARIRYDSDRSRKVDLTLRICHPDGSETTDSDSYSLHSGTGLEMTLPGLGAKKISIYAPGNYRYEIWLDGRRLFSQSFYVVEPDWRLSMDRMMDQATETYSDGSKYRGELSDDGIDWNRDGLGVFRWPEGSFYWGEWSQGYYDGEGIYLVGPTYTIKHCPGSSIYVGSHVKNVRSGKGACYDFKGNLLYEGFFSEGVPTGSYPSAGDPGRKFEIRNDGGGYYVGETRNGKRHGKGVYLSNSGEAWYGDWVDGIRQGEGLMLRPRNMHTDD